MGDASSIRYSSSLLAPAGSNRGSIRYDTTRDIPVYSDGAAWHTFGKVTTQRNVTTLRAKAAGDQISQTIFTAINKCKVIAIKEVHSVASSVASDVLKVWSTPVGLAPGSTSGVLLTTLTLDSTANTVQTGTLTTATAGGGFSVLNLVAGDRLTVSFVGTLTSLAGVTLTVVIEEEISKTSFTPTYVQTFNCVNGDNISQTIFVSPVACRLVAVSETHATAGTHGSAVTVQLKKNGTSGTAMTSVISLKTTINTPQAAVLSTTSSALDLNVGDRITLTYSGTITAVAGVALTLQFVTAAGSETSFVSFNQGAAADLVTDAALIAPGLMSLINVMETHGTATSGACKLQLTKDSGTDAVGTGTGHATLLSDNTNAGFDVNATADTPQDGTPYSLRSAVILETDNRLAAKYSAATTGGAQVCVTAAVRFFLYV